MLCVAARRATLDTEPRTTVQVVSEVHAVRDPSAPQDTRITSAALADLLAEFQRPGQPLHGLGQEDAERVFRQVVEQLLLKVMRERQERGAEN